MAKARNPERDNSKKRWLDSGGDISTKELAAAANVPQNTVRKWKSEDKWQQELDGKRTGGWKENKNAAVHGAPKGNKNAAGHGAPKGNANAETHGAYTQIHLESLSGIERAYIEGATLDARENMLRELQLLMAKEGNYKRKIKEYEAADPSALYIDRVIETIAPKGKEESANNKAGYRTAMKTIIKSSPFERAMKLEVECNKIHGRIIKLIDTMKSYELDRERIALEHKRYSLMKQRATGEYNIDTGTGEIIDTETAEDADGLDIV